MVRASFSRSLQWIVLALVGVALAALELPKTLVLALGMPVVGFVLLLLLWAYRWSKRVGEDGLNRFHIAMQTASHGLTALGVLTVAVLFVEERQWDPRLSVEVRPDAHILPDAPERTAVVQLAIAIKNEGRISEDVNFLEVTALGLRGTAAQDPRELPDLRATQLYKVRTSRGIGIGAGETEYQYVEVPVSCDWSLVRFLIKVPMPPARLRHGSEKIPVYERKLLVPLDGVCSNREAISPQSNPVRLHQQ